MRALTLTLLLTLLPCLAHSRVIQFYVEPTQKLMPTYFQQLVIGNISKIDQGIKMTASVTIIFDGGYYVVVDSPSATNLNAKELLLRGIAAKNISPGEVQFVVTTHGHPDHFGQGNFFPNARHFFGSYEYTDDNFISTELRENNTMKITRNIELWNTPGHTSQDVSVMVHNTPCCGTVAVVGDLFYNEEDAKSGTEWYEDAWNPLIGQMNREKVLCYADYIVPGHGKAFKVTPEMKQNCSEPPLSLNIQFAETGETNKTNKIEMTTSTMNITMNITTTTTTSTESPFTTTPHVVTVDQILELQAPLETKPLEDIAKKMENWEFLNDETNRMLDTYYPKVELPVALEQTAKKSDSVLSNVIENAFRKFKSNVESLESAWEAIQKGLGSFGTNNQQLIESSKKLLNTIH
ncbi:unnamed protein product [Auanema sp. JU1783]|nr:unnamed protein product [Auanema sp. JU1783]